MKPRINTNAHRCFHPCATVFICDLTCFEATMADARHRRPNHLEIDNDSVTRRVAALRRRVGPRVKIFAALKADGYGFGTLPMARAALAGGADGIMVDVHPEPEKALCDGPQSLRPEEFVNLMNDLRAIAGVLKVTL